MVNTSIILHYHAIDNIAAVLYINVRVSVQQPIIFSVYIAYNTYFGIYVDMMMF